MLFHLLIGRRHPPALRLQLWSDLVRTLRLESLTQTGCLVGQLSMQWGSMLPMKALFYHLVDLLGSKLFPGVAGGALDRRRHVLSSLSLLNFTSSFLLAAPPTTLRKKFVASLRRHRHRRKSRNNWTPTSHKGHTHRSGPRLRGIRGVDSVPCCKCEIRKRGLRHSGTSVSQLTEQWLSGHRSDHADNDGGIDALAQRA